MKQKFLCFFLVLLLVNLTVKTSEAIAPAIAIPAVAIGTALLATSVGTYYATSDDPVVVKGKQIFQKAHLAKKIGLDLGADVLGDLMADGGGFYAGVPAYIGAGIKDIADYVQQSGSNAYDYWSGLIKDNSSGSLVDDFPLNSSSVFSYKGQSYCLPNSYHSRTTFTNSSILSRFDILFSDSGGVRYGVSKSSSNNNVTFVVIADEGESFSSGSKLYTCYYYSCPITTKDPNIPLLPSVVDYNTLASAINPAEAKDETEKILSQLPPSALVASSAPDVSGIGGQNDAPPALSHSQLQSVLGQMQSDIAGNSSDDIGHIASSNPTDVNAQIEAEKAQAEAEQKALEEAQEALETPASIPADPEWGELDLSPLLVLKDAFLSNAPFSWLVDLGTIWDVLVTDPVAPVFTVNLGIVSHDVDLSVFDSFAALIRSVMSFLVYLGTGWFLINVWRNM